MVLRSLLGAAAVLSLATSAFAQTAPAAPAAPAPAPVAAAPAYAQIAPSGTILHTLQQSGQFRTLLKILDMSGLSGPGLLGRPQAITLFAPTDAAFAAMPAADLTRLMQPQNAAALQARFVYLIYNGPLPWAQLKDHTGPVTGAGGAIYIDGASTPPKANDATILQTEVTATNGAIYVVDKVIGPGYVPPAPVDAAAAAPATPPAK